MIHFPSRFGDLFPFPALAHLLGVWGSPHPHRVLAEADAQGLKAPSNELCRLGLRVEHRPEIPRADLGRFALFPVDEPGGRARPGEVWDRID